MRTSFQSISIGISALLLLSLACGLFSLPATPKMPTTSIYATALSVGGTHACALLNNGTVACWGDNASGQLGDGTYTKQPRAEIVPGLSSVKAVSAGGEHTCALTADGKVKCWGDNTSGQLGDGTETSRNTPVDVVGLPEEVTKIVASSEQTCVILKSGKIMCWGKGIFGQLGSKDAKLKNPNPLAVSNLDDPVSSVSSKGEHACALTVSGKVYCWGHNSFGQVGDGTDASIRRTPVNISSLGSGNTLISAGFGTSCALTGVGEVYCWGWIGLQQSFKSPIRVEAFSKNNIGLAIGGSHICVLTKNGGVKCLGENKKGQLGNGENNPNYNGVKVSGLNNGVTFIDSFFETTCALNSAGEVWCWGDNSAGQLGNGTTENSSIPVKVVGITQ